MPIQIGGIASGLDTESLVKDMMKLEQLKVDREYRLKSKTEWRLETYADLAQDVKSFRNNYFSAIGSKSMIHSSAYNAYDLSYTANRFVKLSASGSVSAKNLEIYGIQKATSASVASKELATNKASQAGSKNYLSTTAVGSDVSGKVTDPDAAIGSEGKFTINGTEVSYDASTTYQQLMDKVSNIKDSSGKQLYNMNFSGGKFSIESTTLGVKGNIALKNVSGTALGADGFLGLNPTTYTAASSPAPTAKITGNVSSYTSKDDVLGSAMAFSINGVDFSFNADDKVSDVMAKVNQTKNAGVNMSFDSTTGKFSLANTSSSPNSKLKVSGASGLGIDNATVATPSRKITANSELSELGITAETSFSINGQNFTVDSSTTIQDMLDMVNSSGAKADMHFNEASGSFSINAENANEALKLSGDIFGADSLTGIKEGDFAASKSANLNIDMSIGDYARLMGKDLTDGYLEFTVESGTGSKTLRFDESTALSTVMSGVNGAGLNVQFSYSQINDSFTIADKTTGAASKMQLSGSGFDLLGMGAGSTPEVVAGRDAVVSLKTDNGSIRNITSSTNSFVRDGINFNLTADFNLKADSDPSKDEDNLFVTTNPQAPITSDFTYNADKVVDKVKEFIKDYNALIDKLSGLISEKVYKDYQPLTQDERDALSETEVENWDKKSKSGILRNNNSINSLLSDLRQQFYTKIGDTGMSAADLGITTKTRSDTGDILNGQLELSESGEKKLRNVLETNPDAVRSVLAGSGNAKGTFQRLSDSMNNFAKSITNVNIKKETESLVDAEKKIKKMAADMLVKEQNLWNKFARMEKQLTTLNSSKSLFASMLGG